MKIMRFFTKIAAAQNEDALSYHRVRGLVITECTGYIFWQLFLHNYILFRLVKLETKQGWKLLLVVIAF